MSPFRYYFFLVLLIIPAAIVDDVFGGIESTGWRYTIRILWLLIVFAVLSLVPRPVKQ